MKTKDAEFINFVKLIILPEIKKVSIKLKGATIDNVGHNLFERKPSINLYRYFLKKVCLFLKKNYFLKINSNYYITNDYNSICERRKFFIVIHL